MSLILATPGTGDLIAKQGATNQWVFTLTTGGSPYDVSAFRIRMQIKRTPSLTAPAVWTGDSLAGQIAVSGPGSNVVTITVPNDAELPDGRLYYDVRFDDEQAGQTAYYVQGRVTILASGTTEGT